MEYSNAWTKDQFDVGTWSDFTNTGKNPSNARRSLVKLGDIDIVGIQIQHVLLMAWMDISPIRVKGEGLQLIVEGCPRLQPQL